MKWGIEPDRLEDRKRSKYPGRLRLDRNRLRQVLPITERITSQYGDLTGSRSAQSGHRL